MQAPNTNFERVSPFNTTPVEKAHKARTRWYCQPFCLFINTRLKKNIKKEMDRNNNKLKNIVKKKKKKLAEK